MKLEASAAKRGRVHTVYKTKDGKRVPGVTTILGVINKPALVRWANNLGLQGIDSQRCSGTLEVAPTRYRNISVLIGIGIYPGRDRYRRKRCYLFL